MNPTSQPPLEPVQPKRNSLTVVLLLLVLLLIASTGYLGYQNMQLQKQIVEMNKVLYETASELTAPIISLEPTSTIEADSPQISNCVNKELKIGLTTPNNSWKCESIENSGAGWINLKSPIFTISMTDLGRGLFCNVTDPDCKTSQYYVNDNVVLTMYSYKGENKEIFGDIKVGKKPWISIKYTNMETTNLTSAQKAELTSLLDSIKAN